MSIPKKLKLEEITNEHSKNLSPYLQKIKDTDVDPDHPDYIIHRFLTDSDISVKSEGSDICEFLKGKCIFITGGTGFLGRTLIEKLLRASREIETIYLLVRAKKGKHQEERIKESFNGVLFSCLSDMYPDFRSKIAIIFGDISQPGLGINDVNRRKLTEKINIIYHVAATTRFDEKLRQATDINVKGTREILKLAKECKILESLVYVGTAYSNCDKKQIEERFYEPCIKPEELIAIVDACNDQMLERITASILIGVPNTYTLTKQVAENIIATEANGLPIAVFRPSIVLTTYKEPLKGWSDNIFGAVGCMVGTATGIIRTVPLNEDLIADFVPVDFVINACIACSYRTAKVKHEEIPVYNYTSYNENPAKWGILKYVLDGFVGKVGSAMILWYPIYIPVRWEWLYLIMNFLLHKLPGYFIDAGMIICGKDARVGVVYKKIDKFIDALKFFTLNEFHFDNGNVRKLWDSLSQLDKQNFDFDLKHVDWREELIRMILGGRIYIVNESFNNLKAGRAYFRKLYFAHTLLKTVVFSLLAYFLYKLLQLIF